MDVSEIAKRVKKGEAVTPAEYARLISNDKEAFMAFLIANNPGSMNDVLRHKLGYTHELQFKPDVKVLTRLCQIILDRNNATEIKTIFENFQINKTALSPELLNQIDAAFNPKK